ncbi:MAG: YjjG family noncanonical pyrimidine nucleotidase [Bacteroidia bacterium]|nr:YjjG family noncanonical pyrimidine nucleotidase [Bacteroidia bacterium]
MNKNKYRHIFFDLDDTLWDFRRNSSETLHDLYYKYNLKKAGINSPEDFISKYQERNSMMWEQYRLGAIDKDTLRNKRFELTFWDMGIDPSVVPRGMAEDYITISPTRTNLYPYAHEILFWLSEKYSLHIITNGFKEVQDIKLSSCGIKKYFSSIIISELTGFKKPDVRIFQYALTEAGAIAEESIMIGDGLEVDIAGARNSGIDQVFFNPDGLQYNHQITHEIKSLKELQNIL